MGKPNNKGKSNNKEKIKNMKAPNNKGKPKSMSSRFRSSLRSFFGIKKNPRSNVTNPPKIFTNSLITYTNPLSRFANPLSKFAKPSSRFANIPSKFANLPSTFTNEGSSRKTSINTTSNSIENNPIKNKKSNTNKSSEKPPPPPPKQTSSNGKPMPPPPPPPPRQSQLPFFENIQKRGTNNSKKYSGKPPQPPPPPISSKQSPSQPLTLLPREYAKINPQILGEIVKLKKEPKPEVKNNKSNKERLIERNKLIDNFLKESTTNTRLQIIKRRISQEQSYKNQINKLEEFLPVLKNYSNLKKYNKNNYEDTSQQPPPSITSSSLPSLKSNSTQIKSSPSSIIEQQSSPLKNIKNKKTSKSFSNLIKEGIQLKSVSHRDLKENSKQKQKEETHQNKMLKAARAKEIITQNNENENEWS